MARPDYHVNVNGKVQITVEIRDTPIKLHLTLEGGKTWTFDYTGGTSATATVKEATGREFATLPPTVPRVDGSGLPLNRVNRVSSTGASIEYIDPGGSGM